MPTNLQYNYQAAAEGGLSGKNVLQDLSDRYSRLLQTGDIWNDPQFKMAMQQFLNKMILPQKELERNLTKQGIQGGAYSTAMKGLAEGTAKGGLISSQNVMSEIPNLLKGLATTQQNIFQGEQGQFLDWLKIKNAEDAAHKAQSMAKTQAWIGGLTSLLGSLGSGGGMSSIISLLGGLFGGMGGMGGMTMKSPVSGSYSIK